MAFDVILTPLVSATRRKVPPTSPVYGRRVFRTAEPPRVDVESMVRRHLIWPLDTWYVLRVHSMGFRTGLPFSVSLADRVMPPAMSYGHDMDIW